MEYKRIDEVALINNCSITSKMKFDFINYLDTGNITNGKVDQIQFLEGVNYPSRAKRLVKCNDIVFSTVRPNQCHFGIIKNVVPNMVVSTGFAVLTATNEIDADYLYYYLTLPDIIQKLQNIAETSTSAYPSIKPSDIGNLVIPLPDINTQKKVGSILSSISSKIELNNKINENLQCLSQLVFKHWFIDFEFPNDEGLPYKSSGGEMADSELCMIPKGWEVKQLKEVKEIGTLVMGQSPSGSSYNQEKVGVPLINGAADIKDGNLVPNKYTTEPKKITKVNDLIFCIRATIGLLTISDGEYCLGRGVAAITNIKDNYYEYIYQVIDSSFEKFEKTASGSVYINLSKDDFNNMKLIVPSDEILEKYHNICAPILKLITSNKKQIANLANLRDTLIPKLMCREIDLSNLEINQ